MLTYGIPLLPFVDIFYLCAVTLLYDVILYDVTLLLWWLMVLTSYTAN